MKIAVTYENGQIFRHFGHTEQFKIYTVEQGKIVASEIVDSNGGGAQMALADAGIKLYGGVRGSCDAAVNKCILQTYL